MAVIAPPRPETIPIREAAERLGVHENTVRNWADRGVLKAFKTPTGRRKVVMDDVERLAREMFGAPTEPAELEHVTPVPPQAEAGERASVMP